MKSVRVILSEEAEEVYHYLNKESLNSKTDAMILKAVKNKINLVKENPHYGDPISKKLIPKEYVERYGIRNLFRIELPNFWRMIYSLTDGDTKIEIIAFVLDIFDHKEYNKKFGYKKR